jgi:hypothetical protein
MKTLQRFDVLDFLRIDEVTMFNWLQLMESNYHADNPYHNSTHAADVMHATAYFLACDKLKVNASSRVIHLFLKPFRLLKTALQKWVALSTR